VLTALEAHLSDNDVTADVTEFTFKQLLHDNTQARDGLSSLLLSSVALSGQNYL